MRFLDKDQHLQGESLRNQVKALQTEDPISNRVLIIKKMWDCGKRGWEEIGSFLLDLTVQKFDNIYSADAENYCRRGWT